MKKIIQVTSFLFLAVIFSAVSANAQSAEKFKATIPFAFSIGQKTYEPGNYTVKISNHSEAGSLLTIFDSKGKPINSLVVRSLVDRRDDESTFVFSRSGEDRSLTKIVTRYSAYAVPETSLKRRISVAQKI